MNTQNDWKVEDRVRLLLENLIVDIGVQVTDDYKEKNGIYEGMSIENVRSRDKYTKLFAELLADARREVYLEIEEKVMECKKDITKYQNTTDILNETITKHERAWINSGFRLALESLDKLHKFVLLATLKEVEE